MNADRFKGLMFCVLLLVIGFAAGRATRGRAGEVVARVEGKPIYRAELETAVAERFWDKVLSDLVARRLLEELAAKRGLELRQDEVERRLQLLQQKPETQAALDTGSVTLKELRQNLETLVLLDDLIAHEVDPRTLESFFRLNQESLVRLRLRHLVVAERGRALVLKKEITTQEQFTARATEESLDETSRDLGGDLGDLAISDLPVELAELVRQAQPQQVLGPVKGPYGFHLLWIEQRRDSYQQLAEETLEAYAASQRGEFLKRLRERSRVEILQADP